MSRPRAETQPLFGHQAKEERLAVWVAIGALGILAIESVTVAIVYGVLNNQPDHFSLAVVVLIAAAISIILYRWHAVGDLDPKFKWLLISCGALVLASSIATNVYVFGNKPPVIDLPPVWQCKGVFWPATNHCEELPPVWSCRGFFMPSTNYCYPGDVTKCHNPEFCFVFQLQACMNCSNIVPSWPPTPFPTPMMAPPMLP